MISPLALPALLACASPDYSFYEVIPGSSGDALDAVGAEEVDFRNYCGTLTDPGGYANQPERILGSVWERPVECRENPTGGDCSFIPGYDNLDSSLLSRDSQEIEEEIYREWIHWDGSAGAGDLFDFFNINLQGGAVVEIVGVKTWVGSLFTDQGLDQAVDEFLDDYGSADWEQGYIWSSELIEWTAREYRYMGAEAEVTGWDVVEMEGEYYRESGVQQKLTVAYPCLQPIEAAQEEEPESEDGGDG